MVALVLDPPKLLLLVALGVAVSTAAWLAVTRWSATARRVRDAWSPRATRLLIALCALGCFAVIAADVLLHESDDVVLRADRLVRATARELAQSPPIRRSATVTSRLTGEGLVVLVAGGTIVLLVAHRRRDGAILVLGTLGAWITSGALKLIFGIPRPRSHALAHAGASLGFPSGHAFVTLVAFALAAWLVAREASPACRVALYGVAIVVGALAGASRIVLDAHWLSDVVAGLAFGIAWVAVVLAVFCSTPAPPAD
jgi:membrane-associated phospholipid phosphatase